MQSPQMELHFLILSRMTAERNDLANSKPEKVAELEKRLDAYLKSVEAQMPTINPNYKPGSDFGATKRIGGGGKSGSRGRNGGGKMVERPAGIISAKTTVENVTGKVV